MSIIINGNSWNDVEIKLRANYSNGCLLSSSKDGLRIVKPGSNGIFNEQFEIMWNISDAIIYASEWWFKNE